MVLSLIFSVYRLKYYESCIIKHATCVFKTKKRHAIACLNLERAMRIELTTKAWEAFVLPLNYARIELQL